VGYIFWILFRGQPADILIDYNNFNLHCLFACPKPNKINRSVRYAVITWLQTRRGCVIQLPSNYTFCWQWQISSLASMTLDLGQIRAPSRLNRFLWTRLMSELSDSITHPVAVASHARPSSPLTKYSVTIPAKSTACVTLPHVYARLYAKTARKAKPSVLHFSSTCLTSAPFTMDQPISLSLVFWSCPVRISTATENPVWGFW